ncbi:MAG TPA: ABC transporter ATP-binding protein [Exilispira sp.]|nr:ABC transporter ATP-binding protein [Exilispira sp.]
MNEVLKLENLTKHYINNQEEIEVLNNINLSVYESETISIQGISGVGKTTLLNLIGGFDSPTSGKIFIENQDITEMDETELSYLRNRKIGYIFQSFYLLEELNILENIILPALKLGTPKPEAIDRAYEIAEFIGIEKRLKHYPSEISGGEKQRAAIARAIINNPKIICADEPTGNLDSKHKRIISELLFSIVEKNKQTLILVTHEEDLAKKCNSRYLIENCSLIKN